MPEICHAVLYFAPNNVFLITSAKNRNWDDSETRNRAKRPSTRKIHSYTDFFSLSPFLSFELFLLFAYFYSVSLLSLPYIFCESIALSAQYVRFLNHIYFCEKNSSRMRKKNVINKNLWVPTLAMLGLQYGLRHVCTDFRRWQG